MSKVICPVEECTKFVHCKNLCHTHYMAVRRSRLPKANQRKRKQWTVATNRTTFARQGPLAGKAVRSSSPEITQERALTLLRDTTRTLQSIGDEIGVSRERVRQIGKKAGALEGRKARQAEAFDTWLTEQCVTEAEAWRIIDSLDPCRICGKPVMPRGVRKNHCSKRCSEAWHKLKYSLDPVEQAKHRLVQARSILKRPDFYSETQLSHSRRVVAGDPSVAKPSRTYVSEATAALAAEFGIELASPVVNPGRPRTSGHLMAQCSTVQKDGHVCPCGTPVPFVICGKHRKIHRPTTPSFSTRPAQCIATKVDGNPCTRMTTIPHVHCANHRKVQGAPVQRVLVPRLRDRLRIAEARITELLEALEGAGVADPEDDTKVS